MEETKSEIALHVFICTNQKKDPAKACCAPKGAEALRLELKEWAQQQPGWGKRIRVNASGCLDRCSDGIAVAIYPFGKWLIKTESSDLAALKSEITSLMNKVDILARG